MPSLKRKPARRGAATKKPRRFRRAAATIKAKAAADLAKRPSKGGPKTFSVTRRVGRKPAVAPARTREGDVEPGLIQRVSEAIASAQAQSREKRRRLELDFKIFFDPEKGGTIVSEEAFPAPEAPARTGNERLDRALDAARGRGQVLLGEILSRPEMLTTQAFGQRLGLSPPTVLQRLEAHQVLGLHGAKRGFRFPEWQLDRDGKPFRALPALFDLLGDEWAVYRFLVQHHPELDDLTGIEALQSGQSDKVIETAETVAQSAFG